MGSLKPQVWLGGMGKLVGATIGALFLSALTLCSFTLVTALVLRAAESLGFIQLTEVARRLTDFSYDVADQNQWRMLQLLNGVIQIVVVVVAGLVSLISSLVYWCCYMKPTPGKFIPKGAIVPDDLKGSWKYGLFDCFGDCGTCLCFLFCQPCSMSDLWYRSGWIHALMSDESPEMARAGGSCPAWQFFVGCCGFCLLTDAASCCYPCALAVLTGGIAFLDSGSGGKLGEIVPTRLRFSLPNFGCNTFCEDCCSWCWCFPCQGTREYRQVMDLLNRGPVPVEAFSVPQVITVGRPVVGQAVQVKT
eukprot:TRINITY_DN15698_c0_g1_i2.p1 TRINITY_DN15698_c0_g1~~TRINITY_DN15698_c0_g1_i2.p1  ORF type:complete len:305 (+),score=45.89 TRINITY_DN15698_c0_g1_i2:103-1017(+)